jgi:hypothetical protein
MKPRERIHAEYFANWLNTQKGEHFQISGDEPEDSEIDVILYDDIHKETILLQCVAYRGEGLIYPKPSYTSIKVTGNVSPEIVKLLSSITPVFAPLQKDKKETINSIIKKKEKKYPKDLVEKLTLLIEMTIPKVTPEELKTYFPNGFDTKFKGIYFIQLPIPMVSKDDVYGSTGFIYSLKGV